jgi:hypothetical protein
MENIHPYHTELSVICPHCCSSSSFHMDNSPQVIIPPIQQSRPNYFAATVLKNHKARRKTDSTETEVEVRVHPGPGPPAVQDCPFSESPSLTLQIPRRQPAHAPTPKRECADSKADFPPFRESLPKKAHLALVLTRCTQWQNRKSGATSFQLHFGRRISMVLTAFMSPAASSLNQRLRVRSYRSESHLNRARRQVASASIPSSRNFYEDSSLLMRSNGSLNFSTVTQRPPKSNLGLALPNGYTAARDRLQTYRYEGKCDSSSGTSEL